MDDVIDTASLTSDPDLLAALAALVAAIGGVVGAAVAIREYRLKARVQRAEMDIHLAQLFAQLVPIANGRGQPALLDAALAPILEKVVADGLATEDLKAILDAAFVSAPVGVATQAAAMASMGYLGAEYEALRDSASQSLLALRYADEVPELRQARHKALMRLGVDPN
jgi:hypothetical protein